MQNDDSRTNDEHDRVATLTAIITESVEYLSGKKRDRAEAMRQATTWLRQLRTVPTDLLRDCFERWQESGPRQALRALDLLEAFRADRDLKAKLWERQMTEQPLPQQTADGVQLYRCPLCQDSGYCVVWQWGRRPGYFNSVGVLEVGPLSQAWLCVRRACSCPATPEPQKLPRLWAEEWEHNKRVCEFARRNDLLLHSAPSKEWQAIVEQLRDETTPAQSLLPPVPTHTEDGQPLPF